MASNRAGAERRSVLGVVLTRYYRDSAAGRFFLRVVTRLEGGHIYSGSLREVLRRHHGVLVGAYSYGSLLDPGMADRHTTIGRYCSFGPNIRRFGAAHPIDSPSMHPFWYNPALGFAAEADDVPRTKCSIGNDVWIGANVVILPGCKRIGDGAVVAAGAIVTKDVDPFTLVAGNPAVPKRQRLTPHLQRKLTESDVWNNDPHKLMEVLGELNAELE